MDNIAGPPVEGDNFFGRETTVEHLQQTLVHHDVLLLGPRRIGKTSVARAVMNAVRLNGWKAIEVNVASCVDERGFVEKVAQALELAMQSVAGAVVGSFRESVGSLLGRVKKVQIAGIGGIELGDTKSDEWSEIAADTLRLMSQVQGRWLIYVDELPIMLFNIIEADPECGVARVRRFLDWFRNDVRAMAECKELRWLVTGSVGLDTLVQRHGMSDTINSLKQETLPAYDSALASAMLEHLAKSYSIQFDDGDLAYFVGEISWPQPYYLQRAFNNLRGVLAGSKQATRPLIDKAVTQLSQPDSDNDFQWWRKRLSMQLGKIDGAHADALLLRASQVRSGVEAAVLLTLLSERMMGGSSDDHMEKFVELRDILVRDAYWQRLEIDRIAFYSFNLEPLRQWWSRRAIL